MSMDGLRRALVSLYNGDSAVQAITGRTTNNLVSRGTLAEVEKPVASYFIISSPEPGGTDQRRRVFVQIDIWGTYKQGTTASDLQTMMDRAEALFTGPNLAAQSPSVDAAVFKGSIRDNFPQEDNVLSIGQDFTFELAL